MKIFAEQIFIGAIIELISLLLSYIYKEKPRNAVIIFAIGTSIAGFIAFGPTSPPSDQEHTFEPIKVAIITETPAFTQVLIPITTTTVADTQILEKKTDNWIGILSVRKPTLNEIRAKTPISLWEANILDVRDMYKPGIDNYSGEAQQGEEYLFPVYWCTTTSDLLVKNTEFIETQFSINGEIVPEKYIFNYNYNTNTGWKCNYHAVIFSGWMNNTQYILEIKHTLKKDLFDGQSNYSAGEYIYRLTVKVR